MNLFFLLPVDHPTKGLTDTNNSVNNPKQLAVWLCPLVYDGYLSPSVKKVNKHLEVRKQALMVGSHKVKKVASDAVAFLGRSLRDVAEYISLAATGGQHRQDTAVA